MISLRSATTDDNPVGASPFVAVPVPVGARDGDHVVVAVASPAGNAVSAPDAEWTLAASTRPGPVGGVVVSVWVKEVLGDSGRWVFALASSARAAGVALVYAGLDPFDPVESVSTTSHATDLVVPATAVADDGEELVLFAATGGGTASGFTPTAQKAQATAVALALRLNAPLAVQVPESTLGLTAPSFTASAAVVLRRNVGTTTVREVRDQIARALPRGADRVFDFEPGGDYDAYYGGLAAAIKVPAFDLVDLARAEARPELARLTLPSWEALFGLERSRLALSGTLPQRRAQVLAAWRFAAGVASSRDDVRAVVGTILGYADPLQLDVIECSRAGLTALHTYALTGAIAAGPGVTTTFTAVVPDDGGVAAMGVQLTLKVTHATVADLAVIALVDPLGNAVGHTSGGRLTSGVARGFAMLGDVGERPFGTWSLRVANAGGNAGTLDAGSGIFVEGIGRDAAGHDGRAAAQFYWCAYADPALVSAVARADLAAARRSARRLAPAHTIGTVITDVTAIPSSGLFPGDFIPTP